MQTQSETSNPTPDPWIQRGQIGDYVGGVIGTFVGFVTLIAVFMAWYQGKKIDKKSKIYTIFSEMMRTHEEIVGSIELNGQKGREALSQILSEYYQIYKFTIELVPNYETWNVNDRIDISYYFTYYGPTPHASKLLDRYGADRIKLINDAIATLKHKSAAGDGVKEEIGRFKGHQNRLSHYFRNLYSAFRYIDESDLSAQEKKSLGKVLRTKLSNYEQGVLAINVLSSLGRKWNSTGIINKYAPIKNIPEHFFSFDHKFNLKGSFPKITFEWEGT